MSVGSVANAIAILRHLAVSERQGVNAIARATGLSPSSCFNILKTLVAEDFVDIDAKTKSYGLGPAPFKLFAGGGDISRWKWWLLDQLEQLAASYSICCGLWEVQGQRLVLTDVVESPLSTRIHLSIGQRVPLHIGAMGRTISAHEGIGRKGAEEILGELRWEAPPSIDGYLESLAEVRRLGWAVDDGNYLRGVTTIAVAITDDRDRVSHCLFGALFSGQHEKETLDQIGFSFANLAKESRKRLAAVVRDTAK